MTSSAHPMARSTLEELKGLGPAENLPTIQLTPGGASTTSKEPIAVQLSMLQGYNGATTPKDHKSRTNLLGVMDEPEQEPSSGASDSEDEHNATPRTLNISERRKAQNSKFSAW